MKPYQSFRLGGPFFDDVSGIREQGRKSSIGRVRRGDTMTRYRGNRVCEENLIETINHNDRGYCRTKSKARTRRALKRADKFLSLREELLLEAQAEQEFELEMMMEDDWSDCEDYDYDYDYWDEYDTAPDDYVAPEDVYGTDYYAGYGGEYDY